MSKAAGRTSRRRDNRLRHIPLTIELEDQHFQAVDWSLGGFRIAGYKGNRIAGDKIVVWVSGEVAGQTLRGRAIGTVVRRDAATGEMAAKFKRFHGDTFEVLEQISLRRLRPKVVAAAETEAEAED